MADIIQLLPDTVANQIAAGEVIQRPASVVKELVENAVDAGSDEIKVIVKDAGKTLIQVIDNGLGMSETDARLSFERHATSKIRKADDLFAIRTKGFRGEALASIASIAHVTLKTRQPEAEVGTQLVLAGSVVESQEPISCPFGSNFMVKNLFYNVPARRKFLKSNSTEFKYILIEFQRIVLTHPDIDFTLIHNDQIVLHLPPTNLRQRIIHVFGKQMNNSLTNIDNKTSLANLKGYIGKPEFARKTAGEQYFFINQRYMRHPYFHRAVSKAFENILPGDHYPTYFIFFEVDPQSIDVNIHPTKTEIKFESEQALFQILNAAVKEALGKTNVVPSIDFDTYGVVDIPVMRSDTSFKAPEIPIDYSFNPFETPIKNAGSGLGKGGNFNRPSANTDIQQNWQSLFEGTEKGEMTSNEYASKTLFTDNEQNTHKAISGFEYIQIKNRYILTGVMSGLMVVDQKKAHERILFEQYLRNMAMNKAITQRCLYPEKMDLNHEDYLLLQDIMDDLHIIGFDISDLGGNTLVINGVPDSASKFAVTDLVELMLEEYKQTENTIKGNLKERVAASLAVASAVPYGKALTQHEMQNIVDELFACENPNYSPSGKKTMSIIKMNELEKFLI
jgi:DNA mismatch repair protein MutL